MPFRKATASVKAFRSISHTDGDCITVRRVNETRSDTVGPRFQPFHVSARCRCPSVSVLVRYLERRGTHVAPRTPIHAFAESMSCFRKGPGGFKGSILPAVSHSNK